MTELAGFLETYVNTQMIRIIISGPRNYREKSNFRKLRQLDKKNFIKIMSKMKLYSGC